MQKEGIIKLLEKALILDMNANKCVKTQLNAFITHLFEVITNNVVDQIVCT